MLEEVVTAVKKCFCQYGGSVAEDVMVEVSAIVKVLVRKRQMMVLAMA